MSCLFAIAINVSIDSVSKIRPGCIVEYLSALYHQYSFWNTGPLSIDSVILAFVISFLSQDIRLGPTRLAVFVMLPSTSGIRN